MQRFTHLFIKQNAWFYVLKIALLSLLGINSLNCIAQANLSQPKQIIVGGDFNYPPYEFINEDGELTGYNVELSQEIAAVMGLNIKKFKNLKKIYQ